MLLASVHRAGRATAIVRARARFTPGHAPHLVKHNTAAPTAVRHAHMAAQHNQAGGVRYPPAWIYDAVPQARPSLPGAVSRIASALRALVALRGTSLSAVRHQTRPRLAQAGSTRGFASVTGGDTVTVAVTGLKCGSCVSSVEKALASVPGVASASCNLVTSTALVEMAPGATPSFEAIERAVAEAGCVCLCTCTLLLLLLLLTLRTRVSRYTGAVLDREEPVAARQVTLDVHGLTCGSCVARAERALLALPQVSTASVNLATRQAVVAIDDLSALPALLAALSDAGYPSTVIDDGATCVTAAARDLAWLAG